jgi:hypothetical protein
MAKIGACGDHCDFCPRYHATQSNNQIALEKVKELWVRLGLRAPFFPAGELVCFGCKPDNVCAYSALRDCVMDRNIENCGFCSAYPCKIVVDVFGKTEQWALNHMQKCTKEEYEVLHKAFCQKQIHLGEIYAQNQKKCIRV